MTIDEAFGSYSEASGELLASLNPVNKSRKISDNNCEIIVEKKNYVAENFPIPYKQNSKKKSRYFFRRNR